MPSDIHQGLHKAIPKRNVARMSAKEYRVVPIGKIRILVHNIWLASEAIPEYMNIRRRSKDKPGREIISPASLFFLLEILIFIDDLSIERLRSMTQIKNIKPFIKTAV